MTVDECKDIPLKSSYVVGFMFRKGRGNVALIRKNRPEWQAGKLNGIGGHIEADETPTEAMCREFWEETGANSCAEHWEKVCTMYRSGEQGFLCHVFRCFCDTDLSELKSMTDEKVEVWPVHSLYGALSNVGWLLRMCLDVNPGDFANYKVVGVIGTTKKQG